MGCIWALVWAVDAFRDIPDDQKDLGGYVKFDIVLGVLYSVIAVVEAFGIGAAWTAKLPLVRIYSMLSFFTVAVIMAAEIIRIVLHFTFKTALINNCFNDIRGGTETVTDGGIFDSHTSTSTISDSEATRLCNNSWSNGTFQDVAWLLVATIVGFVFATFNFAFYRQLVDPSLMRTQAPSTAFQMNATRNAFGYRNSSNNIPGYNPYQTQTYADYVPAYDGAKPPGYTSGGYEHFDGDEKAGYTGSGALNPFADTSSHGHGSPPRVPPGLESHDRTKDEGFDSSALEAAMRASESDTKGTGKDASGAGPSSSAR